MPLSVLLCLIALALPALAGAQTPATLDKIKQSGSMTLAYRESSIPFSYLGCRREAGRLRVRDLRRRSSTTSRRPPAAPTCRCSYQAVTSANRIPLLQNGTIDIECGSTTNNSERGKQVAFATNYFYTGTRFLVKTGTHRQRRSPTSRASRSSRPPARPTSRSSAT